ncbi:MAG TPA: YidC/Oxa1 family membrane protein insertase [Bacillota bacterium]|nr:YidC/Oxa1 family membrane protein insertase [Bacillota bacterium]HPT86340.1 YidC/Oxa1 family membrane protein insertase [Bacillota bacterium]
MEIFKSILEFFYSFTHSWGWSIIIFTVLIKLVLFPTTINQFKTMNKMKEVQPKLKEIQEKYKDRPEEYQRRMMEIYQKEKINPLGGCLPLLIQLPILIIFYKLLSNPTFVKEYLQDATFLGIVLHENHNLLLAVISGATTFLQQVLTMPATGNDPQQKTFLYIMPVMLAYFTYQINAGIGIYWITSNIIGIIQQYIINEYFIIKKNIQEKSSES